MATLRLLAPPLAKPSIAFVGHSGARVTLHQQNGRSVVRKRAGFPAQNQRLRRQWEKQAKFAADGVSTPRVLASGEADGLAFFDMDYVPGISVAAQICNGHVPESGKLIAFVAEWIVARKQEVAGCIGADALSAKVASVIAASGANRHMGAAASCLRDVAAELRALSWPDLPGSPCHGDFTTENILSGTGGKLTLIDFDVPDHESYCLDIAKLYQDLLGQWCLRRLALTRAGTIEHLNAQLALQRLRRDMDILLHAMVPELVPELPALTCLNLLRALPYSTDEAVCRFILDRIKALLPRCRRADQPG